MTERAERRPDDPDRVVIRDKRTVDRPAADRATSAPAEGVDVARSDSEAALAERTADLQRVQAEYANYRKRADRDRLAAGDVAISRVLTELLPVLDDIDRARAHGDLTGGLKAVADHLDTVFGKFGLTAFGAVGDPFDPAVHEAVMHAESDEVSAPTCTSVLRPGYRHGERLLRAAMVGVSEPPSAELAAEAPQPGAPAHPEQEVHHPDAESGPQAQAGLEREAEG
ncbi:MAG: nucleotide exchange factor GrpE [Jatrophihabitantaceae bacterium]